MTHLHECFTLLRSYASACKVTHLMRTTPPEQLEGFIDNFDFLLRKAMEKIIGHDLNDQQWLICQLPAKYGGFGLRSEKMTAGAQYVMSLEKCANDMPSHTEGWDLSESSKFGAEAWLKECICTTFDLETYLSGNEQATTRDREGGFVYYPMSLAQQCEYAWYQRLLKSLPEIDRLRLISNSGPTQNWVTALPLSWKNWNLTSKEWLIAARRRLGLAVRTKKTRCSNCRYHEIGLKGDHALRCSGRMGLKMRHDAIKILLARAFRQAGFVVRMEQDGGLHNNRRPADVEIENWVTVSNWSDKKSLCVDIAIIDPLGDFHSGTLQRDGVGAAASEYENRKRRKYRDLKRNFSPFVFEAHGGFGMEAKRVVRELERRRKERECHQTPALLMDLNPWET